MEKEKKVEIKTDALKGQLGFFFGQSFIYQNWIRFVCLYVFSVLLTSATGVLGGAVGLYAYRHGRKGMFFAFHALFLALGLYYATSLAVMHFSILGSLIVFSHLYPRYELFVSMFFSFLATMVGCGLSYLALSSWTPHVLSQRKQEILSQTEGLKEQLENALQIWPALFSCFVLFGLAICLAGEVVVLNFFKSKQKPILSKKIIRDFQLPFSYVWAFLALMVLVFILGNLKDKPEGFQIMLIDPSNNFLEWGYLISMNLAVVVGFLFTFQGLAVMDALFVKRIRKTSVALGVLFYIFCILVFPLIFPMLGFMDQWVQFRKKIKNK